MKTTISIFILMTCFQAFAQNPETPSATPPVPGDSKSHKDFTGKMPGATNETVSEDVKGSIKKARVYFIEPKDGATVSKTFKVKMGVEGYKVRPAGEAPDEVTSGHHHLVVDGEPLKAGIPLPKDEKNIHYGKGETEADVTLKPGKHKLTLQFADGAHRSFGPSLSQTISVLVK
ncbi:MAG: DUF4399 domain-containing protein [Pseudobdellovibrionaceae bacterium]